MQLILLTNFDLSCNLHNTGNINEVDPRLRKHKAGTTS